MPYARPNIERMEPYRPGEQPGDLRVVKLNTNENPYPPAEAVMEAIRSVPAESLRRYPPPHADAFRAVAARVHGVPAEQIIATNGGDELLRLAVTVFCEPAGEARGPGARGGLGVAEPSYSLYPVLAAVQDTPLLRVPLCDDWSLPDDFAEQLNAAGCRLAMIVNPHAPSGHLEPLDRLERFARAFRGVLLIDEAYVDFARRDALPLLEPARRLDNVLLLRTLSKGYSLAGLRFGYGLGSPAIIEALAKAKDSYPTDALAQAAARTALEHRDQARQSWQAVIAQRDRVSDALRRRGWRVPASDANFILATPPAPGAAADQGLSAAGRYARLKERRIFVRYFDQDRLRDKLRITIGTSEQNDALLAAIDELAKRSELKVPSSQL